MDTSKSSALRLPDHELIRLDAAAHPERTPSEHEAAALVANRPRCGGAGGGGGRSRVPVPFWFVSRPRPVVA